MPVAAAVAGVGAAPAAKPAEPVQHLPEGIAAIGLGANLGDARGNIESAIRALQALPDSQLTAQSSLYGTPAWGVEQQPDFINAVVLLQTTLSPEALLAQLLRIEREHGRDRQREQRWGPRTLDLDLLLHGQQRLDLKHLQLPHPQMHRRAFVLVPLLEVAPQLNIPGLGPAQTLLQGLDDAGIRRLGAAGDGVIG